MRRISIYFVKGLLVLLPLLGTFYILAFIYEKISGVGSAILYPFVGRDLPVIDFVLVILMVALLGMVANWWISKKILALIEGFICRMPGVKSIYSTMKDALKSLTGEQKKFDTVALVKLVDHTHRLGFLTIKESPIKDQDGRELVGVYFPQTLQVAGDMYWVTKESVLIVDISVDQALSLIISGGATGSDFVTKSNQWQVITPKNEK